MLPTSFSHVVNEIKSFITIPWCKLTIESGSNPGYSVLGRISRDESVTDALHLVSDSAAVSAKGVDVSARHRRPDQEIGGTLRNEDWTLRHERRQIGCGGRAATIAADRIDGSSE